MSDIDYSFQFGNQSTGSAQEGPLLSHFGIKAAAGPSNTILLLNPLTHQQIMVQPEVANALLQCTPFRSMEAHVKHLCQIIGPLKDNPEAVRQTLETMQTAGMLVTAESIWQTLTKERLEVRSAPCRVFILTCDRPTALERLLKSLDDFPVKADIDGVWIIDDSRTAAAIEQNAQIAAESAAALPYDVHHFDLSARQSLMDYLRTEVPEAAAEINYLLGRNHWGSAATYGIARNLSLLLSAGCRALVLDDDSILQAALPPSAQEPLQFKHPNDREAVLYGSEEELNAHFLPLEASPLDAMQNTLGQPLSSVLRSHYGGPAALAGCDSKQLARFVNGPSRILMTQCGTWGDPGTPNYEWLKYLPTRSINKLLTGDTALTELFAARQIWMGYRGPALTDIGTMSAVTGLDHTELLPPYLPAGRGEDGLFGVMLQRLHPTSSVWNAGWAIRHEPVEDRTSDVFLTAGNVQPGISTLGEWIGKEPDDQWGLSPERRLLGVADEIFRLTEMSDIGLNRLVAEQQLSGIGASLSRVMTHLENLTQIPGSPHVEPWKVFLESSRDALLAQIQSADQNPMQPLASQFGVSGLTTLRHLGRDFATAIEVWPRLCAAARKFSL